MDDGPVWASSLQMLQAKVKEHTVVPAPPQSIYEQLALELCETEIQHASAQRYGPVTPEDHSKLDRHLDNLETLLRKACIQGTEHWSEGQQKVHGYKPSEVFATVKAEAAYLLPEEYEDGVAKRLQTIMDDPILRNLAHESVVGDSQRCRCSLGAHVPHQLRPRPLYPN